MKKILNIKEAIEVARKIKRQGKTIVVAGGFFDILHLGHIKFLEEAKRYGDYLFVWLEEDKKAEKKGINRPINPQQNRAKILSALQSVDCIVLLKNMTSNACYDKLMIEIRPNIIATTYGDPFVRHKKRQSKLVNGKVIYVIKRIDNHSTAKYIKLININ